jgi:uncharacterized membrane protein YidH (DUF202 family)
LLAVRVFGLGIAALSFKLLGGFFVDTPWSRAHTSKHTIRKQIKVFIVELGREKIMG